MPVPVVLLTGFLGSGKTTLIHHVLSQSHGLRIAVVMNDYEGGAQLEQRMAVLRNKGEEKYDGWISLNNGCLCCSLKDVSVRAIEEMVTRSYAEAEGAIDLVLVEAAGAADPVSLISLFWLDDALESCLVLDGVLATVDASRLGELAKGNEYGDLVSRQIAMADRILLNKEDLVAETEREACEVLVSSTNPAAAFQWSSYAKIDVEFMRELRAFTGDVPTWKRFMEMSSEAQSASVAVPHAVTAIQLHGKSPVDIQAFERALQQLLWDPPSDVTLLRVKGLLVDADGTIHAVQAAGSLYTIDPLDAQDAQQTSSILLVGTGITKAHFAAIQLE